MITQEPCEPQEPPAVVALGHRDHRRLGQRWSRRRPRGAAPGEDGRPFEEPSSVADSPNLLIRPRLRRRRQPPRATEPEMGFEPLTYHLRGGCSAPELLRRTRQDTNGPGRDGSGAAITSCPRAPPLAASGRRRHDARHGVHRARPHRPRPPRDGGHRPLRDRDAGRGWAASFAERFGAELHVVQVIVPSTRPARSTGPPRRPGRAAPPTSCRSTPRSSPASVGTPTS